MKTNNKSPKRLIIFCAVLVLVAALVLVVAFDTDLLNSLLGTNETETVKPMGNQAIVAAVDVGQANCTVIIAGGTTAVIDAGDSGSAPAINSFLRSYGIGKIDYLIMTHPHTDHIGSMSQLIRDYKVKELLYVPLTAENTPTNYTYTELIETVGRYGVKMTPVQRGSIFNLDLGTLTVLSADWHYDSLNNCSMVLSYDYGSVRTLMMADAQKEVEFSLLDSFGNLKSDILFAGHHGSYTSNYRDFVNSVRPRYALISCGRNNDYGYPHEVALKNLTKTGAEILRTDLNGNVVFIIDGTNISVTKEK